MHFSSFPVPILLSLLFSTPTYPAQQLQPTAPCLDAGLYYSSSSGAKQCEPCPAGSYCPEGASSATPCPAGQFQQQKQQSACISCPENYDCSAPGTVTPAACPPGRVSPAGSALSCRLGKG